MSPRNKQYHVSKRSPVASGVILLLLLVVCSDDGEGGGLVFLLATAAEGASGSTGSSGSSGGNHPSGSGPPTPHTVPVPSDRTREAYNALRKDRAACIGPCPSHGGSYTYTKGYYPRGG